MVDRLPRGTIATLAEAIDEAAAMRPPVDEGVFRMRRALRAVVVQQAALRALGLFDAGQDLSTQNEVTQNETDTTTGSRAGLG